MRRLAIATVTLSLAALACGDDGGSPSASPTPTPTPMTKAEYVSAANAICKRVADESEAQPDPMTAPQYLDGVKTYIASIEKGNADVKALRPPAEDAANIQTNFVAVNEKQVEILKGLLPDLEQAAAKNDTAAAEAALQKGFEEYSKVFDPAEKFLTDYGLTECSS